MNVGDTRQRPDGSYEVLASTETSVDRDDFEEWVPAMSFAIQRRTSELPGIPPFLTIHELLLLEGWKPPTSETPEAAARA